MNNSSLLQENEGPINSPGFMAFSILLAVITFLAGVVIGFTIVALFKANAVPIPVRLYLINLLFAGLLVALAAIFSQITSAVLVLVSSNHPRSQYLCRVYLWLFATGVVTRLWSLAAFSLSILAIVIFSKKTINKWIAAVIVLNLWIVPMILSLYILLPYVFEAHFVHGVACYPYNNHTNIVPVRHTLEVTWTVFGGLLPLTVSIIVPIICFCYIRRNIVTEGTEYRKGLGKFSLFLVVGGSINFFGLVFPTTLATWYSATAEVYLCYGSGMISLLPTPIIIVAFLKPVREQAQGILPCSQLSKRRKKIKCTATTYSDYTSTACV